MKPEQWYKLLGFAAVWIVMFLALTIIGNIIAFVLHVAAGVLGLPQ